MGGVFIGQLQCPSCGDIFCRELQREDEPRDQCDGLYHGPSTTIKRFAPPFIECRRGHRWTLQSVTRTEDGDYVQLGDYLGGGEPGSGSGEH